LKPFSVRKDVKYIPTDKEIEDVLSLCTLSQMRLLLFVRDTYCRINEALNLTYNDILNDKVVLYTNKSKNGDRVHRKVALPDCLNNLEIPKDKTERVFCEWKEEPRFLGKKVKLLGQDSWSWHNLRHRGASMMSKKVIPLYDIMRTLGHQNLETTQKYLQELS
ncbi:MAG: site-specific integrase, partial [Candidatus Kapabacteria bacterium]|nr:site-specific integrase [Candidatus Kapabacteria bacterium]